MRRIQIVTVVALILTALIFAYSQSPRSSSRTGQTGDQARKSEVWKAKKLLVKELPKGVEGIVLEKGVFRLKPGYKFVKPSAGTITVARDNGTGGLAQTWSCTCDAGVQRPSGSCTLDTSGVFFTCTKSTCSDSCKMSTALDGNKIGLAIY